MEGVLVVSHSSLKSKCSASLPRWHRCVLQADTLPPQGFACPPQFLIKTRKFPKHNAWFGSLLLSIIFISFSRWMFETIVHSSVGLYTPQHCSLSAAEIRIWWVECSVHEELVGWSQPESGSQRLNIWMETDDKCCPLGVHFGTGAV